MLDWAGVGAQSKFAAGQRGGASYPPKLVPGPALAGILATMCIWTDLSCKLPGPAELRTEDRFIRQILLQAFVLGDFGVP